MSPATTGTATTDTTPAPMVDPALSASARLAPATSLAVFRAVLAAASRPGSVVHLPDAVPPAIPAALLPVLALADLEVRVHVLAGDEADGCGSGTDTRWSAVVEAATGARPAATIGDADLVVALRPPRPEEIAAMRTGDAVAPERGARLVVACSGIGAVSGAGVRIALSGPGAGPGRVVTIGGVAPGVIGAIADAGASFPAGIDVWFVDAHGAMASILRSTTVDDVTELAPAQPARCAHREGDR